MAETRTFTTAAIKQNYPGLLLTEMKPLYFFGFPVPFDRWRPSSLRCCQCGGVTSWWLTELFLLPYIASSQIVGGFV